jgi:hypothetical protein
MKKLDLVDGVHTRTPGVGKEKSINGQFEGCQELPMMDEPRSEINSAAWMARCTDGPP